MTSKFAVIGAAMLLAVQAIDIDCGASSCPDTCTCSVSECKAAVDNCMGDPACASHQDCAFQCPCGDENCLLNCVGETSSAFAPPLMECVQSKCLSNMLAASRDAVDCSAAACQEKCECAMGNCASSVDACLADTDCASSQTCALECACGDEACLLACMEKTNSPLAMTVAECITSKCPVAETLLGAPNLSCHGSACEDVCHCAKSKCLGKGMACLFDPNCAGFQGCSFECACGDRECALGCAQAQSSPKAMILAECIEEKCHTDFAI